MTQQTWINAYGNVVYEKPLAQYTAAEKEEMLQYYVTHGRAAMRKKFGLGNQNASHLLYYNKKRIEEIEDEHFAEHGL